MVNLGAREPTVVPLGHILVPLGDNENDVGYNEIMVAPVKAGMMIAERTVILTSFAHGERITLFLTVTQLSS